MATPRKAAAKKAPQRIDEDGNKIILTNNVEFWQQFVPNGYVLTSWLRAHYALIKKAPGSEVEGPAWITVTEFGTRKAASKGTEAEDNGKQRDTWDEQSKALTAELAAARAARRAKATKKAAAKKAPAKKAEPPKAEPGGKVTPIKASAPSVPARRASRKTTVVS